MPGTIYADIALSPGASIPIDAAADERAVYLADGEAELEGVPLVPMQLYVLRPGVAATLRSASGGRAMLAGGDAFATKRHVWWNFVSSSRERIHEAKRAWMAGEFPTVPGDDKEWIPIPDPRDRIGLGEAQVHRDAAPAVAALMERAPVGEAAAGRAEVERERIGRHVRGRRTRDVDADAFVVVRPQHAVAATGRAVACRRPVGRAVEAPADGAAAAGTFDHRCRHSRGWPSPV